MRLRKKCRHDYHVGLYHNGRGGFFEHFGLVDHHPGDLHALVSHDVTVQGFAFAPAALTISAGDTVVWSNQDSVAHTVTANGGEFGSSQIPSGGAYSHRFSASGSFPYHCSIHPQMHGTITVQ